MYKIDFEQREVQNNLTKANEWIKLPLELSRCLESAIEASEYRGIRFDILAFERSLSSLPSVCPAFGKAN